MRIVSSRNRRSRRARGVVLVAALLALPVSLAFASGVSAAEEVTAEDAPVLNIGHRGAAGLAPEHTFASYDLALELGADYIEQDLRMTRDGVLVVLHDEDLDRTTRGPAENCTGPVSEKTLAQVKTCDVGSFFNERYPEYARDEYDGLKVPTLEEVFQRYGDRANYYVETRSSEAPPGNPGLDDGSGMEEELLQLMDEYDLRGPAADDWRVLVQSFAPASLEEIHALESGLPLIQLYSGEETGETIRADLDAARTYAVGIGPSKDDVDAELVGSAHALCLDVHPYTLEEEAEMEELVSLGVDGMFADFPDRLEAVLGQNAADGEVAAGKAAEASRACEANSATQIPDTGGPPVFPVVFSSLALLSGLAGSAGLLALRTRNDSDG